MEADFESSSEEVDFIHKTVGETTFIEMLNEIKFDSDFKRITKIREYYEILNFEEMEKQELISVISDLIDVDGKREFLENNMFKGICRLLGLTKS